MWYIQMFQGLTTGKETSGRNVVNERPHDEALSLWTHVLGESPYQIW